LSTDQIVSTSFVASRLAPSPRCHRLLHLAVAAPSPASAEPALRLHPMALLPVSREEGSMPWPCRRQQICRRRRRKGSHRCSLSAYPFDGFAVARRCPHRQRRPGSQWCRASGPRFLHRLHESRLGGPRRTSCPSSCSMERPSPSQCRSSSKPWWALWKDTHNKLEDAPNAAAKGTQPAPPEGSADAAPPASIVKAAEVLLPSLIIWPPS